MKEPKIKVLYLYDKKHPNDVDFIFEDGGFSYTYSHEEDGTITVMSYQDRIDENTDLENLLDALQGSPAQLHFFNGEHDIKKKKIDKDVLHEVLTWHYPHIYSVSDFELIKVEHSENDVKTIKGFLKMIGGFNYDKKEVACNETEN